MRHVGLALWKLETSYPAEPFRSANDNHDEYGESVVLLFRKERIQPSPELIATQATILKLRVGMLIMLATLIFVAMMTTSLWFVSLGLIPIIFWPRSVTGLVPFTAIPAPQDESNLVATIQPYILHGWVPIIFQKNRPHLPQLSPWDPINPHETVKAALESLESYRLRAKYFSNTYIYIRDPFSYDP
jgi:hypothetical protein